MNAGRQRLKVHIVAVSVLLPDLLPFAASQQMAAQECIVESSTANGQRAHAARARTQVDAADISGVPLG
jgi:hypothetical protein